MGAGAEEKSAGGDVRGRFRQARAAAGERWVVLFDGECAFCNHSVQFIHRKDTFRQFFFSPLQGEYAKGVLAKWPELRGLDTVTLVDERGGELVRARTLSGGVLEISRRLGGAWWWLALLWWIPSPLRNLGYRIIAKYRRKLLRKKGTACMVPTAAFRTQCLP
jgi:predicted DCC family thiol-disulfide oxidoreductase YuxK